MLSKSADLIEGVNRFPLRGHPGDCQLIHFNSERSIELNVSSFGKAEMADVQKAVVAAQVPFFDLCMVMQKISDAQGKDKKKEIFKKFLNHWRQAHTKIHGDFKSNVSSECRVNRPNNRNAHLLV